MLYRRLLARGWEQDFIRPIILAAYDSTKQLSSVNSAPTSVRQDIEDEERLFLHLEFHPDDVPSQHIQELFKYHCSKFTLVNSALNYLPPPNIDPKPSATSFHGPSSLKPLANHVRLSWGSIGTNWLLPSSPNFLSALTALLRNAVRDERKLLVSLST